MAYYEIKSLEHLCELKESKFHPNGYIVRNFDLNINSELVKPLIEKYRDDFAFSFKYAKKYIVVYKEKGIIFIRNEKDFNFEFPHCPPPVTTTYSLKVTDIESAVNFILS
ncbi:hypothetical protein [Paenibacillus odorifer]|uniref:hypothetical protein n=1 Tax=Paenibacillus odorifer TaxID=189426 RepID=UPI00096F9CC3|nr:hypothetical protein [Paenibacillus odorifer]OMD67595.1 hypothetical protein BSK50_29950 [Paenibacillus odorifer]